MSLLKTNEIQNYNGSSLTLTASTVSTSAQLNTGGNISVTGSLNVSDDSTTRTNLGLGTIATQDSDSITVTGGTATLGALTVSGSDSGDLVRITQTGSGNALVVEDSANPDSTPFVVDASGNVGVNTSSVVASDVGLEIRDKILAVTVSSGDSRIFLGGSTSPNHSAGQIRYDTSGNSLEFYANSSERMRITSTGDVEYPWSNTANYKLGVAQSPTNGFFTNTSVLEIHGADPLSGAQAMGGGSVKIRGGSGFGTAAGAAGDVILEAGSSLTGGSAIGGIIQFNTGSSTTERMRIDSSGNVNISNLSASSDVQTDASKNLITTSDARLKNEIGLITKSGVEIINQIIPKYFSWKNDENNTQQLGFFAQDIYPVLPEAAPRALKYTEVGRDENDGLILEQVFDEDGNPDYEWGFTDRPIVAMLVKAVQEQQTIIEFQQSQIDALTTQIEALATT